MKNIEYFPPNFEGLVLGFIDADFCGGGQAQIVEKEKKHYQGLPEDLTPTAGKVGASAAEK